MDSKGWCGLNSIQSVGVCRQSVSALYEVPDILIMPGPDKMDGKQKIAFHL
jgi:hypothetical protein